jgi:hypothetical protein
MLLPVRLSLTTRAVCLAVGPALLLLQCGPIGSTTSPPGDDTSSSSSSGSDSSGGSSSSSGGGSTSSSGSGGSSSSGSGSSSGPPLSGLHVQGNVLVDNGKTVRLLGVNKSGTEYQCVHNQGIFDGPNGSNLVTPMKTWNINTVRVPLNEDCWLGINGVPSSSAGSMYQQAITTFVQMLRSNGMYVIVDLHWNAPGTTMATSQQPMPDKDHAVDFWTSVATTLKGDNGILFDLYNEPHPDIPGPGSGGSSDPGGCLLNGCSLSSWTGYSGSAQAVGMKDLVTAVRGTGAQNVLMIGGWAYSGTIGTIQQYLPSDPLNNIAISFHTYNNTPQCNTLACWNASVKYVAMSLPVITGELGEKDCATSFVDQYFQFADPLGISYLGWAWNTSDCSSVPSLITSYAGAPTPFGQAFMTHLPTQ